MTEPRSSAKLPRILHVMAGAEVGGAESIFIENVVALAESGHSQAVLLRPSPLRESQLAAHEITIATAPFGRFWRRSTARALAELAARFKPHIVQFWMGRAASFARPLGAVNLGWYGGYYDPKRFRGCDYHLAITPDVAAHLREQGIAPERIGLLLTYADAGDAAPIDRAILDTPTDAPVLLALARLHHKKGLDILLRALVDLPDAIAWIAGDGPLRQELQQLAQNLGVDARVRFLGWRTDRFSLLRAADLCVFPSRYEPFGTVMPDAWAAGTPLVAAAAAGPRAFIRDGVDGLLVPIDDVGALTAAIRRVLTEPGLREALIAGGSATHRARFSKHAFQDSALALYRAAIAGESLSFTQDVASANAPS